METHPFSPFFPDDAKVLILGTFPSLDHRGFYYTSPKNLMWPIFEKIFNKTLSCGVNWDICAIKNLCEQKGIALCDVGLIIGRKKGSSSDKNLIYAQELDLKKMLSEYLPKCTTVLCTGEDVYKHVSKQFGVSKQDSFVMTIKNREVTFVEAYSTSGRNNPIFQKVLDDYHAKLSSARVVIPRRCTNNMNQNEPL